MRLFDTDVQELKYKVLKEVARLAWEDRLEECYYEIPKTIIPGPESSMRCCIYKERAIVEERVKLAMGGDKSNENVIEVLPIACDECPVDRIVVGPACRGCIAHRCQNACPKGAITIVDRHARIDKDKCIGCGKCISACPYSAIYKPVRPCERACKINAIAMNDEGKASIDNDKCISCGACVYQCPFGAIVDKAYILECIDLLRKSENNKKYKTYAVIAPSISSQFSYAKIGQVVSGIKALGFHTVVEAALGADMTADRESLELAEKGFLMSSCCPSFVSYIEKAFPALQGHISHNLSPMAMVGQYIKKIDPTAKIVFIGPCTSKKMEIKRETVRDIIDCVITFEELQALLDSRGIHAEDLPEGVLDNASYYGRIFARCGGLADAVAQALKEHGIGEEQFKLSGVSCDGIEECKLALLKAKAGKLDANFIEGMACVGGCIGGPACLTHGPKSKADVDKYGAEAREKTIADAIGVLKTVAD
ncbi:4Fe-4S dicluster domain-containing protein [Feifania hominis]|uniref:4Fe-4S dicluster domain-containing protein n=1 Tax=Feifania hominis TaxID=2763660 RepID=A0A926DED2_9FIRM|nr:4Fe-4S dicluster domain-containing protein [Feifania hominis]MBC8536259.1 4Fe-4S dicluster domain-containing protein [Feifania hominis]